MSGPLLSAACGLIALIVLAATALQGWHGWLALKRLELEHQLRRPLAMPGSNDVAMRIELAALRERVRQLEAIASGVDL